MFLYRSLNGGLGYAYTQEHSSNADISRGFWKIFMSVLYGKDCEYSNVGWWDKSVDWMVWWLMQFTFYCGYLQTILYDYFSVLYFVVIKWVERQKGVISVLMNQVKLFFYTQLFLSQDNFQHSKMFYLEHFKKHIILSHSYYKCNISIRTRFSYSNYSCMFQVNSALYKVERQDLP